MREGEVFRDGDTGEVVQGVEVWGETAATCGVRILEATEVGWRTG